MTDNISPTAARTEEQAKIVGYVTPAERDEIQALFERRNGLAEMFRIVTGMSREELDSNGLYERLVTDMGQTATEFQRWWDRMSLHYGWESAPNGRWEIDFNTCAITLVQQV